MANCCIFEMETIGALEDLEKFFDALSQKGRFAIGRAPEFDRPYIAENGDGMFRANIEGCAAWSVEGSLVTDEERMKKQKEIGIGPFNSEFIRTHEILTLPEASEKFDLTIEIFSFEPGCEFSEHIVVDCGDVLKNDTVSYQEIFPEDYNSFEEFQKDYPEASEEDFRTGEALCIGGFDPVFTI